MSCKADKFSIYERFCPILKKNVAIDRHSKDQRAFTICSCREECAKTMGGCKNSHWK